MPIDENRPKVTYNVGDKIELISNGYYIQNALPENLEYIRNGDQVLTVQIVEIKTAKTILE